jgi:hypothetical protein
MHDDSTIGPESHSAGLNPYHPPPLAASQEDPDSNQRPRRPIGLSILAFFHGLGSVGILLFLVVLAGTRGTHDWAERAGLSLALVVIAGLVCGALGLASAYGMWTGARWGWWLSSWYYVTDGVGHTLALASTPLQFRRLDADALTEFLVKHCVRLLISLLLVLYFFRRNVLRFFGLESLKKWKAVGILIGLSLVFLVSVALVTVAYLIMSRR